MVLGGVSIKGSYHKKNQDYFTARAIDNGFVVVLSDGLGSKRHSGKGSKAVCRCAVRTAERLGERLLEISPEKLVKKIHKKWLRYIKPYAPDDCCATLLLFIAYKNRGIAARLGDGFIGIVLDGGTYVLLDRKDFLDVTCCLSETLNTDEFEFVEFELSELSGGVMCSDGVGVGDMTEETVGSFVRDFVEGNSGMTSADITEDVRGWLKDWYGKDDKTLAFFIEETPHS